MTYSLASDCGTMTAFSPSLVEIWQPVSSTGGGHHMEPTWKSSSGEDSTGEAMTHANEATIAAATSTNAAINVQRGRGHAAISFERGRLRNGRRRGMPRCGPKRRGPT